MTACDVHKLIRAKYPAPEYATVFEVSNATGLERNRRADAISMSLYPSRGLDITGFEVKVSKGDWKRELANPDKAEEIASYCDFWVVVAPEGVVPLDELPENWGLLVAKTDTIGKLSLVHAKRPTRLQPKPLGKPFVASLFRKVAEQLAPDVEVKKANHEGWLAGIKHGEENAAKAKERDRAELLALREVVARFEEQSGVKLNKWSDPNIGEAVSLILKDKLWRERAIRDLERFNDMFAKEAEAAAKAIAQLREVAK